MKKRHLIKFIIISGFKKIRKLGIDEKCINMTNGIYSLKNPQVISYSVVKD